MLVMVILLSFVVTRRPQAEVAFGAAGGAGTPVSGEVLTSLALVTAEPVSVLAAMGQPVGAGRSPATRMAIFLGCCRR